MIWTPGKPLLTAIACVCLLAISAVRVNAQCNNEGFEDSTFTNWIGETSSVPNPISWSPASLSSMAADQPVTSTQQFTILTQNGVDPNSISPSTNAPDACMTFLAPGGGNVSVRLGNANTGAQTERLRLTIPVTSSNTGFIYQYAVVLEDPGHGPSDQPRFDVKLYDQNNVVIPGPCGSYSVYAGSDPSFITTPSGTVKYKCWTTAGISLIPYIGQNITIEFATADCGQGGHYGYAYIDASCSALQASVAFCPADTNVILAAPIGYATYQWHNNASATSPILGATNDTLIVTNPQLGDTFSVVMTSVAGCQTVLQAVLQYTNINTAFTTSNNPCYGDNQGSITMNTSNGIPPFNYTLVNATTGATVQTGTSTGSAPFTFSNLFAGTYVVNTSTNGGCFQQDTITILQPPPPPDTMDVAYNFCPDDPFIVLHAPTTSSTYTYQWFDATNPSVVIGTDDSLVVANPAVGGLYLVQIQPPFGCPILDSVALNYNPPQLPDYILKNNVFTPNGDGKNDRFEVFFPYTKTFHIEIFNRWGKKVYESDNFNVGEGWDGKIKGAAADEGVYYWIATYTSRCTLDSEKEYVSRGFVHLIRSKK